MLIFCDLNRSLLEDRLPEVGIVAVGGIPILEDCDGNPTIFNSPIDADRLKKRLTEGLGLGAVLTYRNPKGKSLRGLGELCLDLGHTWTHHTLTLTVVFTNTPRSVRDAFAFDGRFHLSWSERDPDPDCVTFTACGSLKNWKRLLGHADDKSFKRVQRVWFEKAGAVILQFV